MYNLSKEVRYVPLPQVAGRGRQSASRGEVGGRAGALMPMRPPLHHPLGQRSKRERDQQADQRRGSARQRGYDSRWDKARRTFLAEHPLCVMCEREGRVTPATVVDHIKPHRGDQDLFWDRANWQPLCKAHHDSAKQREEARGHAQGCDVSGRPIDPAHPWNAGR